jgi:hypothetical protein
MLHVAVVVNAAYGRPQFVGETPPVFAATSAGTLGSLRAQNHTLIVELVRSIVYLARSIVSTRKMYGGMNTPAAAICVECWAVCIGLLSLYAASLVAVIIRDTVVTGHRADLRVSNGEGYGAASWNLPATHRALARSRHGATMIGME